MKAKRIFLAVLLTAALSVSCAAPAVLAESPAVPEVTTITVFCPNLGEEDYMGLQSADGETLLPPAFASIEVVANSRLCTATRRIRSTSMIGRSARSWRNIR